MSPPTQLRRQSPVRRSRHRRAPSRRSRLGWRVKAAAGTILALVLWIGWGIIARATAPKGNTVADRFDAIVVVGSAADDDGNPKPMMLSRITEGVHEYQRGVAPRLILTGGAVRNQYVEARVMARVAEAYGVPATSILLEPQARDTIQNVCYSARVMKEHGWHTAEVVSSAEQLPRAGLILSHAPIEWRVHTAPPLAPPSDFMEKARTALEILKTMRYVLYAGRTESCSP